MAQAPGDHVMEPIQRHQVVPGFLKDVKIFFDRLRPLLLLGQLVHGGETVGGRPAFARQADGGKRSLGLDSFRGGYCDCERQNYKPEPGAEIHDDAL
jgi:hypothetical protein